MFKVGPLVEDIHRMHNFLKEKKILRFMPAQYHEYSRSFKVKKGLNSLNLFESTLSSMKLLRINRKEIETLPKLLREKIKIEQNLKEQYIQDLSESVPFLHDINYEDIVTSLIKLMRTIA